MVAGFRTIAERSSRVGRMNAASRPAMARSRDDGSGSTGSTQASDRSDEMKKQAEDVAHCRSNVAVRCRMTSCEIHPVYAMNRDSHPTHRFVRNRRSAPYTLRKIAAPRLRSCYCFSSIEGVSCAGNTAVLLPGFHKRSCHTSGGCRAYWYPETTNHSYRSRTVECEPPVVLLVAQKPNG